MFKRNIINLSDSRESIKCFMFIDLKTHKLTHQNIGQMDMYSFTAMARAFEVLVNS